MEMRLGTQNEVWNLLIKIKKCLKFNDFPCQREFYTTSLNGRIFFCLANSFTLLFRITYLFQDLLKYICSTQVIPKPFKKAILNEMYADKWYKYIEYEQINSTYTKDSINKIQNNMPHPICGYSSKVHKWFWITFLDLYSFHMNKEHYALFPTSTHYCFIIFQLIFAIGIIRSLLSPKRASHINNEKKNYNKLSIFETFSLVK